MAAFLSQPLNTIVEPLPPSSRQQSDRAQSLTSTSRTPASAERRFEATKSPPPVSQSRRHASSVSIGSVPRHQRTSSSILSRAAAALDRTHSAIASISEPVIRNRQSNSTLARLSLTAPSHQLRDEPASPDRPTAFNYPSSQSLLSNPGDSKQSTFSSAQHSPTQPSTGLSSESPSPNKMHQTSSRLLRMTDDDRPFTRVCYLTFAHLTLPFLLPLSFSSFSLLCSWFSSQDMPCARINF